MLRSTHERAVVELTQDFARNYARLEAVAQARSAPPPIPPIQALTLQQLMLSGGSAAALSAAHGRPVFQCLALRAPGETATGCMIAVISGRMGDSDMRRFRDFAVAYAQDVDPSKRIDSMCDRLGKEVDGE